MEAGLNGVTICIVENFNNGVLDMATVNFSVPDDIKAEFDRVFVW